MLWKVVNMINSHKFFMAIFVVETTEYHSIGKNKHKTISSYVSLYDNFERTINKFCERFAKQDYVLKDITVFISDIDFREEWEILKADNAIPWSIKNTELLKRRPDIESSNLYCAEGFKQRNYRKWGAQQPLTKQS